MTTTSNPASIGGTPLSREEMEALKRRYVARHEAGHLTVLLSLGVHARAWIEESTDTTGTEGRTCIEGGCTELIPAPRPMNRKKRGEDRFILGPQNYEREAAIMAAAGCLAAEMASRADFRVDRFICHLLRDPMGIGMSHTDMDCLDWEDEKAVTANVKKAFRLLTTRWEFCDWATAHLHDHGHVSQIAASAAFRQAKKPY